MDEWILLHDWRSFAGQLSIVCSMSSSVDVVESSGGCKVAETYALPFEQNPLSIVVQLCWPAFYCLSSSVDVVESSGGCKVAEKGETICQFSKKRVWG